MCKKEEYLRGYYLRNKVKLNAKRYQNIKKQRDKTGSVCNERKDNFIYKCY